MSEFAGEQGHSMNVVEHSILAWLRHVAPDETMTTPNCDGLALDELRVVYSSIEVLSRLAGSDVLNRLPFWLYRPLTTGLKKLRGKNRRPDLPVSINHSPITALYDSCLQNMNGTKDTASLTVCLMHDVDTSDCHSRWPETMDLEEELGLRSTWNVLTAGPYALERVLIADTRRRGFEIGLHGDTHDMAIGYRDLGNVRSRLSRALDLIGQPVSGYRAPALGFSEPLLQLLGEMGFLYDSSIKLRAYFQSGVDLCIPYRHPCAGIWELPMALSDDSLLRESGLDDDSAINVVRSTAEAIARYHGLLVFNTHPVNLIGREDFYRRILLLFRDEMGARVVLARDLVQTLNMHGY